MWLCGVIKKKWLGRDAKRINPALHISAQRKSAWRLSIGDADTMGAITGAIAGAYYHQIPASLYEFGINKLPEDMKDIINKFDREHGRNVSYKWYNPEFPKEDLVRKVRSGEIFI